MSMDIQLEDLPGVRSKTSKRIQKAGIDSPEQLANASPEEVALRSDFTPREAAEYIYHAHVTVYPEKEDAAERELIQQIQKRLTTGHPGLDEMVDGGFKTQNRMLVRGTQGAGRSWFAHLLAVRAQLPREHGGIDGKTIYFESKRRFDPTKIERVIQGLPNDKREALAQQHETTVDDIETLNREVMNHITVNTPRDSDRQISDTRLLLDSCDFLSGNRLSLGLLIFDGILSNFKNDYPDRDVEGEHLFNRHIHDIQTIAKRENAIAILTTTSGESRNELIHPDYQIHLRQTSGAVGYIELEKPRKTVDETPYCIGGGQLRYSSTEK